MTSICSSPPNSFNHAQMIPKPPLTSGTSFSQLRKGFTSPSRRPLQSPDGLFIPSLHLPRGHDSSDVAAFSKSLEENAAMSAHMAKSSQHCKEPSPVTMTGQVEEKYEECQNDESDPQGPFEGPEKLLELWFADSQSDVSGQGLMAVESPVWEEMLDIVKCKILSTIRGTDADAYLLSESSMFVFPHKLILKTCGTTTLLLGLERILTIANKVLRSSSQSAASTPEELGRQVKQCFYSRKSFMFPERQKGPHKDWMLEVGLLDHFFDQGSAYTVGKMNGDHWLLYMTAAPHVEMEPSAGLVQRPLRLPRLAGPRRSLSDQTLEILMTHLSPSSCARFEFPTNLTAPEQVPGCSVKDRGHLLGTGLSNQLGLHHLFPGTIVDAFAFEPCGFSANAIISGMEGNRKTLEDGYWTVHVTPEQGSSYASFETNVHMDESGGAGKRDLPWLIGQVLSIFEPGRLSVTLFTSSDHRIEVEEEEENNLMMKDAKQQDQGDVLHSLQMKNYKRTDRIAYEFEDYDLVFVSFDRQGIHLPRR